MAVNVCVGEAGQTAQCACSASVIYKFNIKSEYIFRTLSNSLGSIFNLHLTLSSILKLVLDIVCSLLVSIFYFSIYPEANIKSI